MLTHFGEASSILKQNVPNQAHFRRDKLNSQFIVTKISILHAGGLSFFRFQNLHKFQAKDYLQVGTYDSACSASALELEHTSEHRHLRVYGT